MLKLNNIYCGDNLEVLKNIDNNSVQLFFYSPPYFKIKGKYNLESSNAPSNQYNDWLIERIKEMYRTLKPEGSMIINIDDCVENGFRNIFVYELVCRIVKESSFKLFEHLYWSKGKSLCHPKRFRNPVEFIFWFTKSDNFVFNIDELRIPYSPLSLKRMLKPIKKRFSRTEKNQTETLYKTWSPHPQGGLPSTIINIGSQATRISDKHIAVFPEKLATYFVKGGSNVGDIVCDPFCGSGQTLIASKKLGRNYIGIDNNLEYVDFCKKRLTNVQNEVIS